MLHLSIHCQSQLSTPPANPPPPIAQGLCAPLQSYRVPISFITRYSYLTVTSLSTDMFGDRRRIKKGAYTMNL